jgi:uncharacterized lipoprotein YmbA
MMNNKWFNRVAFLSGLFLSVLIAGCSSQPIVINHYLLNASSSVTEQVSQKPKQSDTYILVTDINLPDYLQNRNLVMQQSNGILSVATKHVWAQPLDSDFGGLLAKSLDAYDGVHAYFAPHGTLILKGFRNNNNVKLSIVIEHFMPLDNGTVVLSGYWQVEHQGEVQKPVRFNYSKSLNEDGYAHSVKRMRELIVSLASEIQSEIKTR